ncbi:MAG: lysophospholipid acyltransferase family protein [Chthoniobacterales bacterium]
MSKESNIARIVNCLAYALFPTIRVRIHDVAELKKNSPDHPVIFTFWHNRILAITLAFLRYYPATRKGLVVLTSPSKDGKILAEVARGFGMDAVFGSNNKRPLQAVTQSTSSLNEGKDLAITPDGPRGPCYRLSPGVIFISQKEKIPLLPVHVKFSRCLRLKSWDGFRIPLPFSRIDIKIGPYEWIPQTENDEAFEAERLRIENILNHEVD